MNNLSQFLIKNGVLINDGSIKESDILIKNGRIDKIDNSISAKVNVNTIDAAGAYLIPGVIDSQVHFREPGMTQKADISSESKAAIAGGVTSYIEQPNTIPNATSLFELEKKYIK